jgi:hypothetical protein
MAWLRQSTAAVISFGPFVDKGDGVAYEVGLVSALDHASTGIMLSKNGGALTIRHATVTATTYDARGHYLVTLDTTDTATLGRLRVEFSEPATCLSVWEEFQVLPPTIFDSFCTANAGAIPAAVAGAAGGLFIAGSNAATTAATLSVTGQLDAGNVLVDGTTVLTGTVGTGALTVASQTVTGALTAGTMSVTGQLDAGNLLVDSTVVVGTTTTLTGAVATGAVTKASETITGALTTGSIVNNGVTTLTGAVGTGAVTKASEAITGAYSVGTTTTHTGAVSMGAVTKASEAITGAFSVGTTTTLTGAVSTGAVTKASETVTGALTTGSIVNNGVTTLTGAVGTGAVTKASEAITGAFSVGTTTTLTGAVSTGAVTKASEAITGAFSVGTTTTLTGAVSTGAVTKASETITGQLLAGTMSVTGALDAGSLLVDGTTTLTGAVGTGALTVTGALTATTNAIPWNAAYDAEVQSECTDALNAYDPPTNTEIIADFAAVATAADVAALILATPAQKLATDASGNVTLKSGTHTGAVIPTVSSVTAVAAAGITATSLDNDAITAAKVAADVHTEAADVLLARDIGSGTLAGSTDERAVRAALRAIRNKWSISGTTYTATKEDDTTTAWTATLTTSGVAEPVTASDPTGP